jgi:HSP20 family protein
VSEDLITLELAMPTTRLSLIPALFDAPVGREFDVMRNRMRQFFGEPMPRSVTESADLEPLGWYPNVELSEGADEFTVHAELPGLKPADVVVECEDDTLTIRGTKNEEKKTENGKRRVYVYERNYGTFLRSFAFPKPVNAGKVTAEFADGVLTVRVPKAAEAKPATHKVEIKAK